MFASVGQRLESRARAIDGSGNAGPGVQAIRSASQALRVPSVLSRLAESRRDLDGDLGRQRTWPAKARHHHQSEGRARPRAQPAQALGSRAVSAVGPSRRASGSRLCGPLLSSQDASNIPTGKTRALGQLASATETGLRAPKASPLSAALMGLLRLYKRLVSPLLPRACRFSPSCSEYAWLCVLRHGVVRGALKAAWRVARCSPLSAGGVDLP